MKQREGALAAHKCLTHLCSALAEAVLQRVAQLDEQRVVKRSGEGEAGEAGTQVLCWQVLMVLLHVLKNRPQR